MPETPRRLSRREFSAGSIAPDGSVVVGGPQSAAGLDKRNEPDPHRIALLADTHISSNPQEIFIGTKWPGSPVKSKEHEEVNLADCLQRAAAGVIALEPPPAHVIVNGDCTLSSGLTAEYMEFDRLVAPIRAAGLSLHVNIGNHDNRDRLWEAIPSLKTEQMGLQTCVITTDRANLFLLDSGVGILGSEQFDWLAAQLDLHDDKPALVFPHHNPYRRGEPRVIPAMKDGPQLLNLISQRKQVKACVFAHTHDWAVEQHDGIHMINLPAVSYYFGKGKAHGWVDLRLTQGGANLELRCIDSNHAQHGQQLNLSWRA